MFKRKFCFKMTVRDWRGKNQSLKTAMSHETNLDLDLTKYSYFETLIAFV